MGAAGGEPSKSLDRQEEPPEPHIHDLKTWPIYYDAVEAGWKKFEARKDDRDFQEGDILRLRRWSLGRQEYTGKEMMKRVTYVLRNSEHVAPGYCVMSIEDTGTPDPAPAAARDAGEETYSVGQLVRLTKDIWDDGEDHHPPGYIAKKGETVIIRRITRFGISVSHESVTDNAFVIHLEECEPLSATPPPIAPVAREIECTCGQDSAGEFSMLCPVHNPRHRPVPVAREETSEVDAMLQRCTGFESIAKAIVPKAKELEHQRDEARNALTNNLWSEWEIERAKTKVELETARADRDAWKQGKYEAEKDWSNLLEESHAEVARLKEELSDTKDMRDRLHQSSRETQATLATATARTDALEDAGGKLMESIAQTFWTSFDGNEQVTATVESLREDAGDVLADAFKALADILATRPATRAAGEHGPDTEGQA